MPLISSIGRRFGRNEGEAPPPDPGPSPGTQLLTNSDFIDKTGDAATGWTSSNGWLPWAFQNTPGQPAVNRPCTVQTMPIRAGVYPTSSSSGFVIFSYVRSTISQTVNITGLGGINSIVTILNIANVSNGTADSYTFTVTFKNAAGTTLYTLTTGSITAPTGFTDVPLTLDRSTSPNFDNIKSITVSINSIDAGFWGGQYGPAMDYCTVTVY